MGKKVIERYWNGGHLAAHDRIRQGAYDAIRRDIHEGCVFPAVRENEIHLYYEGGRALRIRPRSVYTHSQYQGGGGGSDTSVCLTQEKYEKIKGECKGHDHNCPQPNQPKNKYKEGWIVSRLFERFSFWSKAADPDQPKLIDIEVRFRSPSKGSEQGSEKVDLLFLRPDGDLRFVEVKRQYDARIRSASRCPEVVAQVKGYQQILDEQENRDAILAAYRCASKSLKEALDLDTFPRATKVAKHVPILVCREDARTGRDRWLAPRLQANLAGEIKDDYLVIDGGTIEENVYPGCPPPWCRPSGLWKCMDIGLIFNTVDEFLSASGKPS